MKSTVSKEVKYIGSDGPLEKACEQVFTWKHSSKKLIVILWHPGWIWGGQNHWETLHEVLEEATGELRILVAINGATPDVDGTTESRRALKALLRALAMDANLGDGSPRVAGGWCSLSDFPRLWSATVCWTKSDSSSLLRLCKVTKTLSERSAELGEKALPRPTLSEFFHFLDDPAHFRTNALHEKPDDAVEGLRSLKWLATLATIDPRTRINILLVENKPKDLFAADKEVGKQLKKLARGNDELSPLRFFSNATYYVIEEDFHEIALKESREKIKCNKWNFNKESSTATKGRRSAAVPWEKIDLVLQDIVLNERNDECTETGLDLVEHYFEACPQALVFMLTSLDVETLVGSGDVNWKYVDCVISKKALPTIWYEYQRCFRERFGGMFWPDWATAVDKDRDLLRGLFGSLRRWQIEPDILWHGQTLPEMIDHAHRHITALWKLVNEFIGILMENGGANMDVLNLRHRVALAVAVWMHDVGHRGDEYITGSMDIRASHAGISERLLLRNPDAYRMRWLLDPANMPHKPCMDVDRGMKARLECRNQTSCSKSDGTPLCLIREAGLLCRHHQSNAPLDRKSLEHMATRGKEPSIYSLTPDSDGKRTLNSEEFLFAISNPTLPSPSARGLKVMLLTDFKTTHPENFRILAGLLRMLDAMQLHRSRVGTSAFIAGFNEFVETKFAWCRSERIRLEDARRAATPGRKSFQDASAKLAELDDYEILLRTQQVHFWRQAAVHDNKVRWVWDEDGSARIDTCYILDSQALSHLDTLQTWLVDSSGREYGFKLGELLDPKGGAAKDKWIHNLLEEVIGSEHNSQYIAKPFNPKHGYLGVLRPSLKFTVSGKVREERECEQAFAAPHP